MAKKWRTEVNMKTNRTGKIHAQREVATRADPLEVKGLAIAYRLTQAQVRVLLLQCGRDWLKFDRAATRLRTQ